ncbi:MAG: ATP-dependent helicase [Lachnospiraceae bacterium]|nr:ATP-dependent helicase [Lachnospiraceae bacterium]
MHKIINQSQQKAIQHGTGPALVLAGPGSGKTFVITNRIKHMIESYHISPENILVITFTKAASTEMEERFHKLMQGEFFPVQFGTFHAIFFHILQYAYEFTYSNIIKESEKKEYLQEVLELYESSECEEVTSLLNEISKVKNMGIPISGYTSQSMEPEKFREIYGNYRALFQRNRKIDFDDMVLSCYELLKQDINMRNFWREKYKYILIDEFQDINLLQYKTIKLLACPDNNLFVVGDDDQSIYGFRGSKPEILMGFEKDFTNSERILLDVNYRCSGMIVNASKKVILENQKRYAKEITSQNADGEQVMMHGFTSEKEECENIIHLIQGIYRQGVPYSEIAMIYRTNEGMSNMAERLIEKQIPVQMKEKVTSIYQHFIAKDILSYLKFSLSGERKEFFQIMNKPKRYLSRKACTDSGIDFRALYRYYGDKSYIQERIRRLEYDIRKIRQMNPYAAINYIRKGIGYDDHIGTYAREQGTNVEEWLTLLGELQKNAIPYDTIQEYVQHTEDVVEEFQKMNHAKEKKEEDAVQIMTMHGSKGLEFRNVILPDLNEKIIPHKKAISADEIEEERRLFYVAMTRAKERLFLFYIASKVECKEPSRFLKVLIK